MFVGENMKGTNVAGITITVIVKGCKYKLDSPPFTFLTAIIQAN